VADFIGMLYRRNLVKFGPAREMFSSRIPVVRQFLAGDTEGPIGMSEEKDAAKTADATRDPDAVGEEAETEGGAKSSHGMTYEETEEMERSAGAPEEANR
jgi:phospholipid/cholesterol/gamma-HCH transport system ATP-binding protein